MRSLRILAMGLALVLLSGCGIPKDMRGTSREAEARGYIRAGIVAGSNSDTDDENPTGSEVEAVERFASKLGLEIHWIVDSEPELMESLENAEIDLVVGGITNSDAWTKHVAVSRPIDPSVREKHVIAVPPGENDWLFALDKSLAGENE